MLASLLERKNEGDFERKDIYVKNWIIRYFKMKDY